MAEITVTSHALVRFMERAACFDFGPWREAVTAAGGHEDADLISAIEQGRSLDTYRDAIAETVQPGADAGRDAVSADGLTFCLDGACVVDVVKGRPRAPAPIKRRPSTTAERAAA